MGDEPDGRWLLLIHQVPPKPGYLRVKVWRRLQRLGAVPIKNSVYALPRTEQAREDFQWVLREVAEGGGDATICEARLVEGLSDEQVESLFRAARDSDYRGIAEEAGRVLREIRTARSADPAPRARAEAESGRLKRRLAETAVIDFFGAPGRGAAERRVAELEARLRPGESAVGSRAHGRARAEGYQGRTWATRKGLHVDRMASAWLIRRFVDPDAAFKFVPAKGYRPAAGEVRFDMFEAEFTHDGDRCTFEVLVERFRLADPALRPIAEIVHDIDLKDGKFGRPETAGIDRLVAGIAMGRREDEARLARGTAVFEDLYEYFRRKSADAWPGAAVAGRAERSPRPSRASPGRTEG